jgi:hypothetical protein
MTTQTHPAPHRHRVSASLMLFAVTGAGAAWLIQLIVDYGLAAHRCFPADMPVLSPSVPGGWSYPFLLVLNLLAIVTAVAAGIAARRIWHRTKEEHGGSTRHLLAAGEGRTRFLAMWGQLAGLGFLVAILFDTVAIYMGPRCFG